MKFRKPFIVFMAMFLWGGSVVFADSVIQSVRVIVNGTELDEGGIISEGKTFLPLRQVANSLGAIVTWDDSAKKASIYKPNVHMFLFQDNKIFGNVDKGSKLTFNVFAQIDNLQIPISAVKVSIFDPSGKETVIQSQSINTSKDSFWYRTEDTKYYFDSAGKYAIRFYLKTSSNEDWKLVSEKLVSAQ